jgi:hypothetical protein
MIQTDKMQLDGINFDIIDIPKGGPAEMQINKRYIAFTRSLLEEMGYPEYVFVGINAKEKKFAVKECKESDKRSYKFSRPKGAQKKPKHCMIIPVRKSVITMLGDMWDENKSYACKGKYDPEEKSMIFDLKECYIREVVKK